MPGLGGKTCKPVVQYVLVPRYLFERRKELGERATAHRIGGFITNTPDSLNGTHSIPSAVCKIFSAGQSVLCQHLVVSVYPKFHSEEIRCVISLWALQFPRWLF